MGLSRGSDQCFSRGSDPGFSGASDPVFSRGSDPGFLPVGPRFDLDVFSGLGSGSTSLLVRLSSRARTKPNKKTA